MAVEPFAVGFDLGKEYSQICCWNKSLKEPVSISVVAGAQRYRIPHGKPGAVPEKGDEAFKAIWQDP